MINVFVRCFKLLGYIIHFRSLTSFPYNTFSLALLSLGRNLLAKKTFHLFCCFTIIGMNLLHNFCEVLCVFVLQRTLVFGIRFVMRRNGCALLRLDLPLTQLTMDLATLTLLVEQWHNSYAVPEF